MNIGLQDKNGTEIKVGDKVRFYFCGDHPDITEPRSCPDFCDGATEMNDIVTMKDGIAYFTCPELGGAGALAIRFHSRCEVMK